LSFRNITVCCNHVFEGEPDASVGHEAQDLVEI
jgi:hypothetical protein